jgi:hypothetical protein
VKHAAWQIRKEQTGEEAVGKAAAVKVQVAAVVRRALKVLPFANWF